MLINNASYYQCHEATMSFTLSTWSPTCSSMNAPIFTAPFTAKSTGSQAYQAKVIIIREANHARLFVLCDNCNVKICHVMQCEMWFCIVCLHSDTFIAKYKSIYWSLNSILFVSSWQTDGTLLCMYVCMYEIL